MFFNKNDIGKQAGYIGYFTDDENCEKKNKRRIDAAKGGNSQKYKRSSNNIKEVIDQTLIVAIHSVFRCTYSSQNRTS